MKTSYFLKIVTLLLVSSLLLWNCQKEEIPFSQEQTKLANYTLEKLNYDDLLKDTEIQKSLPLLEQNFSNNKQYKGEEIAEGLTILTKNVNKIVTNGNITWAFKIKTPVLQNSDFENFLIKKHQNEFKKVTNYDINENNCTDQALDCLKTGGINLPDTEGNWFLNIGGGSNPADLGEDIREMDIDNLPENSEAEFSKNKAPKNNCK